MNKEEWLTYRKKSFYEFNEFCIKYQEKLKGQEKNLVTRFMLKTLEEYQQAWPLIKLCTGESFEKEHWSKLYSILKLPKDKKVENLLFGDLVGSIKDMLKGQKAIKDLCDKAMGEVTIREAIKELRVWCEDT